MNTLFINEVERFNEKAKIRNQGNGQIKHEFCPRKVSIPLNSGASHEEEGMNAIQDQRNIYSNCPVGKSRVFCIIGTG